jgi:serine/threonine-protein kinase
VTTEPHWEQLQRLFHEAMALAPQDRRVFLANGAHDWPHLQGELDRLVEDAEGADPIDGIIDAALNALTQSVRSLEGELVGAYRLTRLIAEGGMGAVFLAERADQQFEKQVAIKLLGSPLLGDELKRHFLEERQILAKLTHPNIATLFDGGSTASGLPYLVMEYVDGIPLDRYCEEEGLDLRQRLKIFRDICAAVHHAHQQLVVHCDLKMTNILVNRDGQPQLLDFGISRMLDTNLKGIQEIEEEPWNSSRRMTLRYASPEQVLQQDISAATDTYALGLILCELIAKLGPYDDVSGDPQTYTDAIVEREPTAPSVLARQKSIPWRRHLRGELDAIVLRALEKRPEDRYASSASLAEDVDRYLRRQTVRAYRGSWQYPVRKFFARNPGLSATTLAVFFSALGFAALLVIKNQEVSQERDLAQTERRKAEAITAFLSDMFREVTPENARGDTVTVYEVLQKASAALGTQREAQLLKQPELRASIQRTIGQVYTDLGIPAEAEPLIVDAIATLENLGKTDTLEYLDALEARADLLIIQFRHEEALDVNTRALRLSQALTGPDDDRSLALEYKHGRLLHMTGNLEAARSIFEGNYQARLRVHGAQHEDTLDALRRVGVIHHWLGDYATAQERYQSCVDMALEALGATHVVTMECISNLGSVFETTGFYREAENYIRKSIELLSIVKGERHPDTLRANHNLADTLRGAGEYAESEELFLSTLDQRRDVLGDTHIETLQTQMKLARLYRILGHFDDAKPLITTAVEEQEKQLGFAHPTTLIAAQELADFYLESGQVTAAEALYTQILEARTDTLGAEHPDLINTLAGLALASQALDRSDAAERSMARAKRLSTSNPNVRVFGYEDTVTAFEHGQSKAREAEMSGGGP